MSIDSRRNDELQSLSNQISACAFSHGRKLRTLYLLTKLVRGSPKPQNHPLPYDALPYDTPPSPEEIIFLEANDITKNRTFQEDSLPDPFQDVVQNAMQPDEPSSLRAASPSRARSPLSEVFTPTSRLPSSPERKSPSPVHLIEAAPAALAAPKAATSTPPPSPGSIINVRPRSVDHIVAPLVPCVDADATALTSATGVSEPNNDIHKVEQEAVIEPVAKTQEQPARVIHLPPKEIQEKHLRDLERGQESARWRERKEDELHAVTTSLVDAVSSPSSTTGAYSTSTPKPPHQSPDTSPDAEYSPINRVGTETAGTNELAILKGDGRLDKMDMEESGRQDNSEITPDAQLRLEEEQANKLAMQSEGRDQPSSIDNAGTGFTDGVNVEVKDVATVETIATAKEATLSMPRDIAGQGQPEAPECTTPFKTPKRPTINTNTSDFDAEMQDMTLASMTPGSAGSVSIVRQTPTEQPTRMTTRVASGAIRQKSVSEILGETPRPVAPQPERTASQNRSFTTPLAFRQSVATPSEDKSRHSMVVFSKKDKSLSPLRGSRYEPDGYLALKGAHEDPGRDYLRPLFLHQAYSPPRATILGDLITHANKTLTTTDVYSNIRESMDYRILRRIYHLQNANKWSLRQMAKHPDPAPPVTHQDHLIAEMKWMRTDFREERSWRMAAARRLADTCATYAAASAELREKLRVRAKIPARPTQDTTVEEPPELVHSASTDSEDDIPDEEELLRRSTTAPTALFSLGHDDVIFELDFTPAGERILNELPFFDTKPTETSLFHVSTAPANVLIPVSKYSTGKLVPKCNGAHRKRSRFDYESEEDESVPSDQPAKRRASEVSLFTSPARLSPRHRELPPEETDVALFNPINRHIRDRLHANHAFRPPSEFQMPSTNFFEHRIASQWTWDEDQKLRICVKKFSYNWSLIAMELQAFSQPSMFIAASERRTPWECFERWYQLEGLPNDMDKTAYFRTYRQRIEAANRTIAAQQQASQQAASQTPGPIPMRRRPTTQPYRVERRRDSRYINMVDAIRKLARKRETAQHRQAESAKAAALRKQHTEATQARSTSIHTPQEFSRMKHERELKILERQEIYRQQLIQQNHQRVAQLQRTQMMSQPGMGPPVGQHQRNGVPNGMQGPSPPAQMNNGQPGPAGLARHPAQQVMQNNMPNGSMNAMGMNVPQAQMQASMQTQQRMPIHNGQDNLRMALAQQRAAVQQQFQMQQQSNQPNNLAAAHFNAPNGAMQTPAPLMHGGVAGRPNGIPNGVAGPSGNSTTPQGFHPGQAQSQLNQPPQQLSSGHTPALMFHQQQVAAQFPNFNSEQILKLANERLKGQMQRISATALNSATGSPAPAMPSMKMTQGTPGPYHANGMPAGHSPTQYQQQLHRSMQQQQQATRLSGSPSTINVRPVSRSATPQGPLNLHQQRPDNGQGMSEQSPNLQQAQMSRP